MPASDQHPEYVKNLPKWQLVRDCVEGSKAIKSRTGSGVQGNSVMWSQPGTRYLPPPNPGDPSIENRERYIAYVIRANFVNFTGHTKEGMLGMAFRKMPTIKLPANIEYLVDDINGDGLSFDQAARDVVGDILETGRYGLLVDYPAVPEGLTKAQIEMLDVRATIQPYVAENILNWRCETVGAINKLVMVTLNEPTQKYADDGFSYEEVDYTRVLMIDDKGTYIQRMYNEDGNQVGGDIIPKRSDGKTWTDIPFVFIGAQNNDRTVDKGPLYDIAEINIAHYRNSADYEESCFMVGQPTPVISGLTQAWAESILKEGVYFGSRRSILLPENASADLLQADANQMPEKGMERKEQQMTMIGARIIQDSTGAETAEAAKIRFAGQNSKLGTIVGNVQDAFYKCFAWAVDFMGGTGETSLEFNTQFYESTIDPQLLMAQIQLRDRGILADSDVRRNLRRGNLIDSERTDEQINQEASDQNPMI